MTIFTFKPLAKKVIFSDHDMSVELTDGRKLSVPLAFFPRLLAASPKQRLRYVISGGGLGLHWDGLDEDISVEALFKGVVDHAVSQRETQVQSRKIRAA